MAESTIWNCSHPQKSAEVLLHKISTQNKDSWTKLNGVLFSPTFFHRNRKEQIKVLPLLTLSGTPRLSISDNSWGYSIVVMWWSGPLPPLPSSLSQGHSLGLSLDYWLVGGQLPLSLSEKLSAPRNFCCLKSSCFLKIALKTYFYLSNSLSGIILLLDFSRNIPVITGLDCGHSGNLLTTRVNQLATL